jgi:hypothetical protein
MFIRHLSNKVADRKKVLDEHVSKVEAVVKEEGKLRE